MYVKNFDQIFAPPLAGISLCWYKIHTVLSRQFGMSVKSYTKWWHVIGFVYEGKDFYQYHPTLWGYSIRLWTNYFYLIEQNKLLWHLMSGGTMFILSLHFSQRESVRLSKTGYFSVIQVAFEGNLPEWGLLKFGFGRDVPLWNLKVNPYKYQFLKKKWPIHIIEPILLQILSKITQFFQNFLKF